MKIKVSCALLLTIVMGATVPVAPTQAVVKLTVSPVVVEINGKPGGGASVEISVSNGGDEAFDAAIQPVPYPHVDPSLSVPEWLSVGETSLHIEPATSSTVTVTVTFPEDQSSGGRYAGLSIKSNSGADGENNAGVSGELIVAFLMTVEGEEDLTLAANIEKFAPVMELDGRLGFRALVRDTGNIHWKATGKVFVKKDDGSEYGNLDIGESRLFPHSSNLLQTTSTLPVEAGSTFTAMTEIDYGADKPKRADTEFTFTQELSVGGRVCENLDTGPKVTAALDNSGDLGVMTSVDMTIATASGELLGRSNAGEAAVAWPNETSESTANLPQRLPSGDYILTIEATTGTGNPIVSEAPFSIGGTGPNVAPICEQPNSTTPDAD